METSNGALINRRRTKLHYQPRYLYSPILSHCQELANTSWCAACSCIGMRNPTKSAIFLAMEILHPGPWFRTQSSYYLKPNLSALFQWRTSCAARYWVSSPDSSSWEISHFSTMEKAMEKEASLFLVHQLLHAPLVIHLSRDPRWSFQWRIYW